MSSVEHAVFIGHRRSSSAYACVASEKRSVSFFCAKRATPPPRGGVNGTYIRLCTIYSVVQYIAPNQMLLAGIVSNLKYASSSFPAAHAQHLKIRGIYFKQ